MTEFDFTGRTVIITGAGRGIGRAHALLFAQHGANVVVADRDPVADDVAGEISRAGGTARAVQADVSTVEGAEAIVAATVDAFGGIDALVNNAGAVSLGGIEDVTLADLQRFIDIHYLGTFLLSQKAWPHLKSARGAIINTISPSMLGVPGMLAYGSSKGGVFGLTLNLAAEGVAHGIRVNAISPGAATRMLEATAGSIPPETIAWMRTAVLPEQVSPTVVFLASPAAADITGEVFFVAGGAVARQAWVQGRTYANPTHTVADIAANIDTIRSLEGAEPQGLQSA